MAEGQKPEGCSLASPVEMVRELLFSGGKMHKTHMFEYKEPY